MRIKNSLIPVYRQAKEGEVMRFMADTSLLALAINHIFETRPENFGDASVRVQLLNEIFHYLHSSDSMSDQGKGFGRGYQQILPFLAKLFEKYKVSPFEDTRLAFLGGERYFPHSVFGDDSKSLRDMFSSFRDFQPSEGKTAIDAETSINVITEGKYDYVLSGNVVNFPKIKNIKSVFAGCANMLKPGGLALHGLNYSHDHYDLLLSEEFHKQCGQKRIDNIEPTFENAKSGYTLDYIALEQTASLPLYDFYLNWLENNLIIPKATDSQYLAKLTRAPV